MLSTKITQLQSAINRANLNDIADALRAIAFGDVLRALTTYLRKKNLVTAGTSPYALATLQVLQLPDDAKAHVILRATVKAATAAAQEYAPQAYGATPITLQCAVTPNGDIAFLAADAVTDVDVVYVPEKGDAVETELPVTTNVLTLPVDWVAAGTVILEEVEATAGTSTGKKIVLVPGAGAPAAGQARLNLAKTTVTFAGADAVSKARVKALISSAIDINAVLESEPGIL